MSLLWLGDSAVAPGYTREHMAPTGAIHLALRLAGPAVRLVEDGVAVDRGHAILGGPRSRFYVREVAASRTIGAQLVAGAALPLLGLPASELVEQHVALDAVWGTTAEELREQLAALRPAAALDRFEAALTARLAGTVDPVIAHAANRLDAGVSIARVVDEVGYCHRHFVSLFRTHVGLAPKRYSRVRRVMRAVEAARASDRPWSAIAAATGFADQAHLTRDIGELVGVTPAELRRAGQGLHVPRPTSDSFKTS